MSESNPYCEILGIDVPALERVKDHPEANSFSLLIAALLERGEPITLAEAAERFERAGVAGRGKALASLERCRPARAPVYRDGDSYALDPQDEQADLWVFRLGLRPPRHAPLRVLRPEPPLPTPDQALTVEHLDEAWRDGIPSSWSAQRVAVCVLDAHAGVMAADDVLEFVRSRARSNVLSADSARHWRRGAAIRVHEDGRWELDNDHDAVSSARRALRERIELVRRWARMRPDPAMLEASRERQKRERRARAEQLARMRRVLICSFPAKEPSAVVLIDVEQHELETYVGEEIARATRRLADYDIVAGIDARAQVRALGFDLGARRLAELGPPQKTRRLNRQGRTLKITTKLLAQGSCGIGRPFGDPQVLRRYIREGQETKLRRRLAADAKSLLSLYEYGRLHGAVRLRWGFLDEMIPAPWVHRGEPTLYHLKQTALEAGLALEVVVGSAPGWADPWSRARLVSVQRDEDGWGSRVVDEQGWTLDEHDIQRARLAGSS